MDAAINLILLLLVLTVLVLLHELGHFVAARRAGVTVHEFGIGFPPRAKVLFKRGDTIYTLNWLPIGGFVRMEGEERSPADGTPDEEEDEVQLQPERSDHVESLDPNAFSNQSLRTRLWILFAGVAINFVLAWLIFTAIALLVQPVWNVRLAEVMPDSPAATAGLVGGEFVEEREFELTDAEGQPTGETVTYAIHDDSGDLILAIDGEMFPVFDDLSNSGSARIAPIQYLADRPGQTVVITVERGADGAVEDVEATLRTQEEIDAGQGALGFRMGTSEFGSQQNGIVDSMVIGLERTVETSTLILRALGNVVVGIFSGSGDGLEEVAGPVGMVSVIGDVRASLPPVFLLWFVGLISANLAVLNALPIPPLDGSRAVMAIVQRLSGDRISTATERLVYFTGWVLMMIFIVLVTVGDIQRIFE